MAVLGWNDSGRDWSIDRTGYPVEWTYYDVLMRAFYERYSLQAGSSSGLSLSNISKVGASLLHSSTGKGTDANFNIANVCDWIKNAIGASSSSWYDPSTISYGSINGTPYASLGIAQWTRTTMRAYLETSYGYGDIYDIINSTTGRPAGLVSSWRFVHCLYVILNLCRVLVGSSYDTASEPWASRSDGSDIDWSSAISAFNAAAISYNTNIPFGWYGLHNSSYYAGIWSISRLSAQAITRAGSATSSATAPHDIRHMIIAQISPRLVSTGPDVYSDYANNDFAAAAEDAWIASDVTIANYFRNDYPSVLDQYIDDNNTAPDPTTGTDLYGDGSYYEAGWFAHDGIILLDAGITDGFSYQDDTV